MANQEIKSKKIILIIVEGCSDQESFIRYFRKIKKSRDTEIADVRFEIISGDITSKPITRMSNPKTRVKTVIDNFLNSHINNYQKEDIKEVVHIIDTDGLFISKDRIIEDKDIEKIQYEIDKIRCKDAKAQIKTFEDRKKSIGILCKTHTIYDLDYSIYYLSRNLEHVLHNNTSSNLDDTDKKMLSDEFGKRYTRNINEFIEFMNDPEFAVSGNYDDSWLFIKEGTQSLERYSNLHLYINR